MEGLLDGVQRSPFGDWCKGAKPELPSGNTQALSGSDSAGSDPHLQQCHFTPALVSDCFKDLARKKKNPIDTVRTYISHPVFSPYLKLISPS